MKRWLFLFLLLSWPAQADWNVNAQYGLLTYNVVAGASDNHVVIKAGRGTVYQVSARNTNAATLAYVRLYNATTGFNGCNSATGLIGYWVIPAAATGGGFESSIPLGDAYPLGISICITGGAGFTDTTAAPASGVSVKVSYGG
jgi:hypothetical protein